ncbi:hypothetical protein [Mycolicibacterium sp.]|uniref:hypothetical protein n=1 Tax=Mycolicibacterium sp. TaxID=2320850 RepID=UPI0037CA640E
MILDFNTDADGNPEEMPLKFGHDKQLEADADKLLATGKSTRSKARDIEKMSYDAGIISSDKLEHYDPAVNWKTVDSVRMTPRSPDSMANVRPSRTAVGHVIEDDDLGDSWGLPDGNVCAEPRLHPDRPWTPNAVFRKRLSRIVHDEDSWGSDFERIPLLGANDLTAGVSKVCARCQLRKRFEYFSPSKQSKDGRHAYCKDCRKAHAKNNYVRKNDQVKKNRGQA